MSNILKIAALSILLSGCSNLDARGKEAAKNELFTLKNGALAVMGVVSVVCLKKASDANSQARKAERKIKEEKERADKAEATGLRKYNGLVAFCKEEKYDIGGAESVKTCPICTEAREDLVTPCPNTSGKERHSMCPGCFVNVAKTSWDPKCPNCRGPIALEGEQDRKAVQSYLDHHTIMDHQRRAVERAIRPRFDGGGLILPRRMIL